MATYKIPDEKNVNNIPNDADGLLFKTGNEDSYGNLNLTGKGQSEIAIGTYGDDSTKSAVLSNLTTGTGTKSITISSGAKLYISGGTVTNSADATLTVEGTLEMDGAYKNDMNKTNGMSKDPSCLVVNAGGAVITHSTTLNRGLCTITINNGGSFRSDGNVTNYYYVDVSGGFKTGGTFSNLGSGDYSLLSVNDQGTVSLAALTNAKTSGSDMAATIIVKEGGTLTVDGLVTNQSVRVDKTDFIDGHPLIPYGYYGGITVSGILTGKGTFTNSGTLTIDSNGTLCVGGSLNSQNKYTATATLTSANRVFTNSGTLDSNGSIYADTVTNSGSFTVEGEESPSSVSTTFEAASFSNSSSVSVASFTNSTISISGTVSNSGKSANEGGMTIQNSTFEVKGKFTNSGALDITNSTVTVGTSENTSEILYNSGSGNIAFASKGANSSLTVYGELKNAGKLTVTTESDGGTASITVNGKFTNSNTSASPAELTVDARSSFSANSFVNNNGKFTFVYQDAGTNISIGSFNNSGGTLTIDVTDYLDHYAEKPVAAISGITFTSLSGTIELSDTKERTELLSKISYTLNANNELLLGAPPIFVNAKWTDTDQIPTSVTYNNRTYYLKGDNVNALAFGKAQDAINAASSGATIVFFSTAGSSDIGDFKFYPQGLVTIDKNLIFESNNKNKAVKFDSLKIVSGCTAEFRTGLYSLEDVLDNEGGTLKVVNKTRFNADLVKNANGTITLDKTSRLVAASIDAGVVEVRAGFVYNDLKWIERPYAAKIGDHATIKLVYPYVEGVSPSDEQEGGGGVYETRTIEGKQYNVVVETITPGDQVYAKVVNGQYICYGTAAHHNGYSPADDGWDSFYAATEYGGLQLIDDAFDLSDADSNHIYNTAAIYVNSSGAFRTASLTSDELAEDSKTLTVSGTNLAAGNYSCSVTVGDNVLHGKFVVDVGGTGTVAFMDDLAAADSYTITLADPKYKATAETVDENVTLYLDATGLAAGNDYRYSITTSNGVVLSGDCAVVGENGAVTITNGALVSGTSYTVVLTKGGTFTANSQKLEDEDHRVTVSAESGGNPIVYDSFMGAMNSIYINGHTIGTPESGMIVRLQEGAYTEGDFSMVLGETTQCFVGIGANYNVIVEPDRWWDGKQWHYDNVSMVLGGTFGGITDRSNLMTFYKIKDLTIDDLVVGSNSTSGKEEISVVNFVDIENLTVNYRLKPMNAATIRILNSNVTSKRHFSVPGGTLIIENSHVKLVGQTEHGALSTENNAGGSGTVILRNSVFELQNSSAQSLIVNLKVNCEFTISGTCTVNGIFENLDEAKGSDTYIAFRDAILDENTNIQAGTKIGAALRFEGYNVLEGTTVEQNGDKDMTIEVGSTLDMSSGASITVGGDVEVSNCGSISLDNASISAGSFTNEGNLTLSNGAEISLVDGVFINKENGVLTAELQSDGSLGITKMDGTPVHIENTGTIYIDLSKTDIPEDPYIVLEGLSGSGEVVVIGGGGEYKTDAPPGSTEPVPHIYLFAPSTETLYVNGEWRNQAVYKKGKNVGSYTYFGYNAFDNNPDDDPDTNRDLTFAADTSKVIYYGGSDYSGLNLSGTANAPNQLTITTLETMSTATVDRDTANLALLTTGESQTVTLSGATMSLTAVSNAGTLKVETGESAKLVIPVAPSVSRRDVKVNVTIGSNEEYHTVQAAAGADSVTVESKSFAPGQEYTVSVMDTKQYSAVKDTLTGDITLSVDVVSGNAPRTINVVVRNADGVKYTFTNVEVVAGATSVVLDPRAALDNTSATVSGSPAGITVTNDGGSLTLHVNGDVAAQKVDVYVQKTVGDTVYRFDYTFNVDAHTAGSEEKTYTVSTRLSSDGYYYVEASEPEITATAQVNGISGAQVKAGNVTNNGTLVVASQQDVGQLNLTVESIPEARTARVKVMDGDFTVGTYDVEIDANSTSAIVVSSDLLAGKTYTTTVTDTLFQTVDPSGTGNAPELSFELPEAGEALAIAVQVTNSDTGEIIGTYTARRENKSENFSVVSGEFAAETRYTVTATVGEKEVTRTVYSSTEPVAAPQLEVTVGAGAARTVTAVVKQGTAIVGTFDVPVAENQTTISLVSSEFTGSGYTVSMAGEYTYAGTAEGGIPAVAAPSRKSAKLVLDVDKNDNAGRWIEVVTGDRTYSLFVAKGASKAELDSENFTVGTEYSDVTIKDAYSTSITAKAGESGATLTLTGLSSSDNVIRPEGTIRRTLKATVRDGAVVVDTYTITEISNGTAVISDSRLTAGTEYTVEISDVKTVVATAETLAVFDSTGTVTNNAGKTITVTDATFNAGELVNSGTITITNSQLNVSGTLTNSSAVTMDIDSLITAKSIDNSNDTPDDTSDDGTITIDATSFDPAETDMKKVIDLDNAASEPFTGNALVLKATDAQRDAGIGILYDSAEHDYWVVAADQSTVYVNSAWATDEYGLAHKTGDLIEDSTVGGKKLYYGYNAFGSFTEAYAETLRVNPYTLNGLPQTITTIEVYGPTAKESAKNALLFFGDNGALSNLTITAHGTDTTAAAVIPFLNDDYGINLSPANDVTITINSGITIQTASEEGYNDCSGTVYLNYQRTSGTIALNGTIDSAREIKIYGKTDVSNTGSLKAATLLWINSGATDATASGFDGTVTVIGTGGSWTASDPQVSAENIMISSGKLVVTDSKVASKGLVFGDGDGVAAGDILLASTGTDWTLNNIGTQTGAKGTYQFSAGSITVTGNDSNTINNAGTVDPGEVAVGSGVTLNLTNMSFSALSVTNFGTITVEGKSTLVIGNLSGNAVQLQNGTELTGSSVRGGAINSDYGFTLSSNNSMYGVTLTATGDITNSDTLLINAATDISARSIAGGTIDLKLETIESPWSVRTDDDTLVHVTAEGENLSDVTLIVDGDTENPVASGSFKEGITIGDATYTLVKADQKIYLTEQTRDTLYVNSSYSGKNFGDLTDDGHIYGYNAFSSLRDPALSYKATGAGQDVRAAAVNAKNLVLTGQITNGRTLFYTDQDTVTITTTGENGATFTERLYLMHKIIYKKEGDDWVVYDGETPIADATLPEFILAEGAKLNGGSMLKVGESLDEDDYTGTDSDFKRTAGAVKLTVNGHIKSFIQVNPYSSVTVSGTGSVISEYNGTGVTEGEDQQCTYIRVNGSLTVNGNAEAKVKPVQFKMQRLTFTDGGTLALNNTNAQFSRIRFYDENFTIPTGTATITVTNSIVDKFAGNNLDNIVGGYNFFVYGGSEEKAVTNPSEQTVVLTLDNSVMNVSDKAVFNPNAKTTVTINSSTLNANTITNSGTITMNNDSILIANSYENYGTFDISNSEATYDSFENYGVVTVRNGATFTAGTFTQYGSTTKEMSLAVTNATFNAEVLSYQGGSISVSGSSFTVSSTSDSAEINKVLTITSTSERSSNVSFKEISFGSSGSISMDWRSTLSFTGFGESYTDKLTIDMDGCEITSQAGKKLLVDYTGMGGTPWTEEQYRALLTGTEWKTDDYTLIVDESGDLWASKTYKVAYVTATPSKENEFQTVAEATAIKPEEIIVKGDGSQGAVNYFGEIPTTIDDNVSDDNRPTFSKGVFGGAFIQSQAAADLSSDISLTINDGTFQKILMGGDRIKKSFDYLTIGSPNSESPRRNIDVYIHDGTFSTTVVGGDRLEEGSFTRYGDVTMNIAGGNFASAVAAGQIFSGAVTDGTGFGIINGNVSLNISGGSFGRAVADPGTWIYGGSLANTKENGGRNVIMGNVTTTIDASSKAIKLNNLVAGSYGRGEIQKDATIVLKGSGTNLTISGQIWGGCTGDYYEIDDVTREKTMHSFVIGERILSFTGFDGELKCTKIKQFSHIKFTGDSTVELNNGGIYDLSEVSNWTFANGSTLEGNFKNDFTDDTLYLTGFSSGASCDLITDLNASDNKNVFDGLGGLGAIKLNGSDVGTLTKTATSVSWEAGSSWLGGSISIVDGTEEGTKVMRLALA